MNGAPEQHPAGRKAHLAKLLGIGIVIGLLVAFTLGNSEQVRVSFVFFHSRFSLIWVLLLTNLLGFVVGYLLRGRLGARSSRKH